MLANGFNLGVSVVRYDGVTRRAQTKSLECRKSQKDVKQSDDDYKTDSLQTA